jgi:hypothetical protein
MAAEIFAEIEATLLLLSEARGRAERAARVAGLAGSAEHVREALERTDRDLLALHRRLMDETIFHAAPSDAQLALA